MNLRAGNCRVTESRRQLARTSCEMEAPLTMSVTRTAIRRLKAPHTYVGYVESLFITLMASYFLSMLKHSVAVLVSIVTQNS